MITDTRTKKVIHLCWKLGNGGAEKQMINIVRSQAELGIDVEVVVIHSASHYQDVLKRHKINMRVCRGKNTFSKLIDLYRTLTSYEIGIMLSWMYTANFLAALYCINRRRIRLFWNIRSADIVYKGNSLYTILLIYACALICFVPVAIIYNSRKGQVVHARYYLMAKRNEVVHNGIKPIGKVGVANFVQNSQIIVGSLGRFNEYKDYSTFIKVISSEVIAADKRFIFRLGGYNIIDENQELRSYFKESRVPDNVSLLGPISNLDEYFGKLDIFVVHSKSEGFSNVLLEAAVRKCFLISTDVGDSSAVIKDNRFIVPPGDIRSMSDALQDYAKLTLDERNELINENYLRVTKYFELKKQVKKYNQLIGLVNA